MTYLTFGSLIQTIEKARLYTSKDGPFFVFKEWFFLIAHGKEILHPAALEPRECLAGLYFRNIPHLQEQLRYCREQIETINTNSVVFSHHHNLSKEIINRRFQD